MLCLHQRGAWRALPSPAPSLARAAARMAEPPVDLGFAERPGEPWRLRSDHFPSKVGGRPAWLGEAGLPGPAELQCGGCGRPCAFLLQVYAPLREPRAFHRGVYLFSCIQPACHRPRDPRPFRVFRNQLPRKNDTYSYDPPPDSALPEGSECSIVQLKSGAHLCRVCGGLAPKGCSRCHLAHYCCKTHQVVDWKLAHRNQCCKQPELSAADIPDHGFLFPEYEIITEPEEVESDNENEAEEQKEEKCLETATDVVGTMVESIDEMELEAMAKHETKEDKIFERFKKIIAPQPKQVLRYCRGGDPLWISGEHVPQETDIPNCSCGAKRIYEFQVMPQLLNYLNVDSLGTSIDWGTLAVYTCAESCQNEKPYAEEFLWRQDLAV